MSELQESIVRSQAILMLNRNPGKNYIWKRVYNRFMKCISISKKINKLYLVGQKYELISNY